MDINYKPRTLLSREGYYYCHLDSKTISNTEIYLGINADASDWFEIDENEKNRLEAEWEAKMNLEIE